MYVFSYGQYKSDLNLKRNVFRLVSEFFNFDQAKNNTGLNHRCTYVENPGGGGVIEVFAKIPRGGGGTQG